MIFFPAIVAAGSRNLVPRILTQPGTGRFPLDESLGFVESFSPALVRLATRAAAKEGYEGASEDLAALAGISIEGRQIHRLVNQVGAKVAWALGTGTEHRSSRHSSNVPRSRAVRAAYFCSKP